MSEFSMNTGKLGELASEMSGTAESLRSGVLPTIEYLRLPSGAAPAFDAGFSAAYDEMHETTTQAVSALAAALGEVAQGLGRVVQHYQTMEQRHGQSFDTALD
ncbi:type VII secretion target [Micromonospora orduensis]|uniref:type VII secretion target n=1 Tax=Micromonospora orduensis TaxID=1420891 RepID=UPI00142EBFB0|nr:type VII secretion target [Micromonospora orduensis]